MNEKAMNACKEEMKTMATMSSEMRCMLLDAKNLMREIGNNLLGIEPQEEKSRETRCLFEEMDMNVEEMHVLLNTLASLKERLY